MRAKRIALFEILVIAHSDIVSSFEFWNSNLKVMPFWNYVVEDQRVEHGIII
jgi:hypothetical protein